MVSPRGLVGRSAALDQLAGALAEAAHGSGRLLVVSGEAGMGKTALLGAAAQSAVDLGFWVYRAQCLAGSGAPPLWPWSRLLRSMIIEEAVPDPWLVDRLADVRAAADPSDDGSDRFQLSETLASELERRAGLRPMLIMIDDLQWSDEDSLLLLGYLARRLTSSRVLMVTASRDDALPAGLPATTESLSLAGLDQPAVLELITRTQGSRPAPEVVAAVTRRSGGNPFFVRELTRLALGSGGWVDADTGARRPVPATIAATVRERLDPLPTECRRLLEVVAVSGAAEEDLLAEVLRVPSGEVERRADAAVLARVLTRRPAGHWTFSHDLFREVIVADLASSRRRELHAAIGMALGHLTRSADPVPASVVAQHLAEGGGIVREEARTYAIAAAAEATYRYAHRDAARQLTMALRLTAEDDDVGRQEILLDLAAAQHRAGDRDAAARSLRRVAAATSHPRTVGRAALGFAALEIRSGAAADDNLALLRSAIDGIERSGDEAEEMLARLYAALARELVHSDVGRRPAPEDDPRRAAERAVVLAEQAAAPQARAAALLAQHDAVWQPGTATERLPIIDRLIAAATEAGNADVLAEAIGLRSAALIEIGDPDGVRELRRFIDHSERLGHARGRWVGRARRATVAVIAGDLVQAEEHARAALLLGTEIGVPDAYGCFGTTMISLAVQGRAVPVELPTEDDPVAPLAPLMAGLLDPDHDHHPAVATVPVAALPRDHHLEAPTTAAAAYANWGDQHQCSELYEQLVAFCGIHVVVGGCAAYYGPIDYYLGRLAGALGDHDRARDHLTTAVALARRLGASGWAERAATAAERVAVRPEPVFRQVGSTWLLDYRGRQTHLPDAKGLHDLATLLARPGAEVHVFTLLGRDEPATGADPALDEEAKRRYRRRLAELDDALAESDRVGDADASERAAAELAALRRELATAVGLRGRDRRLGDEVERARKTVSARIRDVLGRIEAVDPELAAHLRQTISLGSRCAYRPAAYARDHDRAW